MKIELTSQAQKDLRKIPDFVADRFYKWVLDITEQGIRNVRKVPGWHDEPLKGDRKGQRSVRLNRSYRAIYKEDKTGGKIELIEVLEINKHKY